MFNIVMPWTKARLRREAEEEAKRVAKKKQDELDAKTTAYFHAQQDKRRLRELKLRVSTTPNLNEMPRSQSGLTAQAVAKKTPRPGYVDDYTNSDSNELAMFASLQQTSVLDTFNDSRSTSCDPSPWSDTGSSSSSSSSSDSCSSSDSGSSSSSSSDSGSCGDSSSW